MAITTETQYWEEHKKFKKKINHLAKNIKKLMKNPKEFIEEYENLMDEGVKTQVISKEYATQMKTTLQKELASPTKFKIFAEEKIRKLKNKFKWK